MTTALQPVVKLARRATRGFLFRKTLPADFGSEKIYVSSLADIRVLMPGMKHSSGDLFDVVRRYVSPGDVVWDVGSNLGILTFSAAMRVGTGGQVYSIEADTRFADVQTRTLRHFTESAGAVTILCAAVADRPGVLDLVIPRNGWARNHLAVVEGNRAEGVEMTKQVVSLTLDWLLERWSPPDFVKIDIEGAEMLAVEGGSRLFTEVRPTAYIECCDDNADAMTAFFRERDYRLYELGPSGEERPIERFAFNTVVKPREA